MYSLNIILKKIEDIVLAIFFIIIVSPVMLIIAIGIKLSSPGPIIFKQWRYGLDGKPIIIYKFRTMTVCEDGYSFHQATPHDDRVTPLGRFLRHRSLDELPQFFNVLQGRMSIVGPRPHTIAMNENFRCKVSGYMMRHKVKPGITGLSQINDCRGVTDTIEKICKRTEFDLRYINNWSIMTDLKIITLTVMKMISCTNAY